MQFIKKDKQRIRARCVGTILVCGASEGAGLGTTSKKKTSPLTRSLRNDVSFRARNERPKIVHGCCM